MKLQPTVVGVIYSIPNSSPGLSVGLPRPHGNEPYRNVVLEQDSPNLSGLTWDPHGPEDYITKVSGTAV